MRWEVKEEKRRLTDGETGNNANNDGERDRSSRNTKGHLLIINPVHLNDIEKEKKVTHTTDKDNSLKTFTQHSDERKKE